MCYNCFVTRFSGSFERLWYGIDRTRKASTGEMGRNPVNDRRSWLAALAFGLVAVVSLCYSVNQMVSSAGGQRRAENPYMRPIAISVTHKVVEVDAFEQPKALDAGIALRYAMAHQQGRSDEIVDTTYWMKERLEIALGPTGDRAEERRVRGHLRAMATERNAGGDILRPEGVADRYLFPPGTLVEEQRSDAGLAGLAAEVWKRDWLTVTYPNRRVALRDAQGRPIRSLLVGLNVTQDGYILKAGVVGNAEIDRASISLNWEVE